MTAAVYKEFIFSLEDKSLYSWPIPYQREQEKMNSGIVEQKQQKKLLFDTKTKI